MRSQLAMGADRQTVALVAHRHAFEQVDGRVAEHSHTNAHQDEAVPTALVQGQEHRNERSGGGEDDCVKRDAGPNTQ